jgi:hypothetical protein
MSHEHGSAGTDPVIEAYKKDIDRTLLRENLRLSVEDRLRQLMALQRFAEALRDAGGALRDRHSASNADASRSRR